MKINREKLPVKNSETNPIYSVGSYILVHPFHKHFPAHNFNNFFSNAKQIPRHATFY